MGIEPTLSAWKAEVLPLNYTRDTLTYDAWWRGKDSNLRRLSRQIYSLLPLTARVPLQNKKLESSQETRHKNLYQAKYKRGIFSYLRSEVNSKTQLLS